MHYGRCLASKVKPAITVIGILIGEEIGVAFTIEGPGFQIMGVTQNEVQTVAMEDVPATRVLYHLLIERTRNSISPNGKLVLIIDEEKKTATITGVTLAKNRNQTPFEFDPPTK